MTVIAMSAAETSRYETLMPVRLLERLRDEAAAGLVSRKRARLHQVCDRRERHGSDHDGFEGRGPRCSLLVDMDDATSELMHLEMAESESALSYLHATRTYRERHGPSASRPHENVEAETVHRQLITSRSVPVARGEKSTPCIPR